MVRSTRLRDWFTFLSFLLEQIVPQDLQNLNKQIKQARENEDFFETDLQTWIFLLKEFKQQMSTTSTTINIEEDQTKPLIYQIRMTSSTSDTKPTKINEYQRSDSAPDAPYASICNDRFEYFHGNAKIDKDGLLVTNGNDSFFGTEVRGQMEYSTGKHCLQFRIENNPSKVLIFIGIISKTAKMGGNLFVSSSVYGWGDYNDYFIAGERQKPDSDVFFSHTREKDVIELVLDCSRRKLRYKNERQQKKQELYIDINKCPFPWQLYISLGGQGDQISLLRSSTSTH